MSSNLSKELRQKYNVPSMPIHRMLELRMCKGTITVNSLAK
jgi:hypothetical protein